MYRVIPALSVALLLVLAGCGAPLDSGGETTTADTPVGTTADGPATATPETTTAPGPERPSTTDPGPETTALVFGDEALVDAASVTADGANVTVTVGGSGESSLVAAPSVAHGGPPRLAIRG